MSAASRASGAPPPLDAPRATLAWLGVLAAPLAWAVHIGARYPLVTPACEQGATWWLHAVSLACAAGATAGLACAVVALRRGRRGEPAPSEEDADFMAPRPPAARRLGVVRMLARAGIVTSLVFLGAIVAEAVTAFVHDPCTGVIVS